MVNRRIPATATSVVTARPDEVRAGFSDDDGWPVHLARFSDVLADVESR